MRTSLVKSVFLLFFSTIAHIAFSTESTYTIDPTVINISRNKDSVKTLYYFRSAETLQSGRRQDKISINYNGQEMAAMVEPGAKVAFIINGSLYEERELKRFLKRHKNQVPASTNSSNEMALNTSKYARIFKLN